MQGRGADIGKKAAVGRPATQKPCNGCAVRELAVHPPPSDFGALGPELLAANRESLRKPMACMNRF